MLWHDFPYQFRIRFRCKLPKDQRVFQIKRIFSIELSLVQNTTLLSFRSGCQSPRSVRLIIHSVYLFIHFARLFIHFARLFTHRLLLRTYDFNLPSRNVPAVFAIFSFIVSFILPKIQSQTNIAHNPMHSNCISAFECIPSNYHSICEGESLMIIFY